MFCFCAMNNELKYLCTKHRKVMNRKCIKGPPNHPLRDVNICCRLVNYNTILLYHIRKVFNGFRTVKLKCNKIW